VKYQTIKGTNDRLPDDAPRWNHVLLTAQRVLERYGAGEIHTPVFEDTGVFKKAVGEGSDIVRKEMYTLTDRGERELTLRPEATAPMVRAYLQHGFASRPTPTKFWTFEPMFRAENVQKGRERQFHQLGLEVIGLGDPVVDAESIDVGYTILKELGLKKFTVRLGSVGDTSDRQEYVAYIKSVLSPVRDRLSEDSQERLDLNPMRILDSKDRKDQALLRELEVKPMLEFLGADARAHFEAVQGFLRDWDVPFVVDSSIVRGLDYYNRTAYEFAHDDLGLTILAGGRYDGLAEILGGQATPGIGWGCGVERVLMALEAEKIVVPEPDGVLAYVLPLDDSQAFHQAFKITRELRKIGKILCSYRYWPLSLRTKGIAVAKKSKPRFLVIVNPEEIAKGFVTVEDLSMEPKYSAQYLEGRIEKIHRDELLHRLNIKLKEEK
jgi:histidyl-tRNA synthetase